MKLNNVKLILITVYLFISSITYGQVSIGSTNPNPSSQLDIVSSNKGLLIPRVRLDGINDNITIENGNIESLLVYNLSVTNNLSQGYYYWSNGAWNRLVASTDFSGGSVNTILNGTTAPTTSTVGNNGDFYIDTSTSRIYGPKTTTGWGIGISLVGSSGSSGTTGINGRTILNGTVAPTGTDGADGDFYIDTATNTIYGPKVSGAWGTGTSLVGTPGTSGTNGTNGTDGKTILNGTSAPAVTLGVDGDFYIDTTNNTIYGPKISGAWGTGTSLVGTSGTNGTNGTNGKTVLNGTVAPAVGDGANGDFYIDTTNNTIYGPKTSGAWGTGTSLVGTPGTSGTNGTNGKTILNGTSAPAATLGTNGDFYIDTATNTIYGPKTSGAWGTGASLVGTPGTSGTNGTNGTDGKTILNGTTAPAATLGANGDFYIDTATNTIYGPKASGAWGTGTSLVGTQGTSGTNGTNGKTILNGTSAPAATLGTNGDFYIDTATNTIYGPKASGAWGTGTSLVGTQGTSGTNGTDGKTVLNGTTAPAATLGTNGDFYIDTTNNTIYGPKASGAWGAGTSLKGSSGVISATNGITKTGSLSSTSLALGGTLSDDVTITTTSTHTLAIDGLQNGSNTDKIVVVDSSTGVLKSINQPTRTTKVVLSAEYAGAVLTDTGINNLGEMSSGNTGAINNWMNYYEWNSSLAIDQNYTVALRYTVPSNFDSWDTSGIKIDYQMQIGTSIEVKLYLSTSSTPLATLSGVNTGSSWSNINIASSLLGTITANDTIIIEIQLTSRDSQPVRVGDITFNYNNK